MQPAYIRTHTHAHTHILCDVIVTYQLKIRTKCPKAHLVAWCNLISSSWRQFKCLAGCSDFHYSLWQVHIVAQHSMQGEDSLHTITQKLRLLNCYFLETLHESPQVQTRTYTIAFSYIHTYTCIYYTAYPATIYVNCSTMWVHCSVE